jgi:hypothetical protein
MSHPNEDDLRNAKRQWDKQRRMELIEKNNKPINTHIKQCAPLSRQRIPASEQSNITILKWHYVCPMCFSSARSPENKVICGMCGCYMEKC